MKFPPSIASHVFRAHVMLRRRAVPASMAVVLCLAVLLDARAQDSTDPAEYRPEDTTVSVTVDTSMDVAVPPELLDTAVAESPDTAALPVRFDSSHTAMQRPSQATMDRFASDDEFLYDRKQRDPETFWDRFLDWITSIPREVLGASGASKMWDLLGKIIAAAALVYVILKLTKTDLRGVFSRSVAAKAGPLVEVGEDIHEMNFDTLVEEAVRSGNYRRAVRLLYLKQIKGLTDRGLISWRIDKTNDDFARELAGTPLNKGFGEIRHVFEYVWYGDLPIDATSYAGVREYFARFGATLGRGA